jgi:SH3-like domain-containing protein
MVVNLITEISLRNKMNKLLPTFFICILLFSAQSFATQQVSKTDYFASLRSSETNVRSGPGQNYPIKFTYNLKAIPIHVINEYDNWSEIEDYEKQTGWISQSLLTKKRTVMVRIVKDFTDMHSKSNHKSRIIYHLENNVVADYLGCAKEWCEIKVNNKKGWVLKIDLFGVDEEVEEL